MPQIMHDSGQNELVCMPPDEYHALCADSEKMLELLRQAEPFILDICKQGGFHAREAGDLHTRIQNAIFTRWVKKSIG